MPLLETTHDLLKKALASGKTIPDIAREAVAREPDGQVNYEWLKKFAAGKIPKPGVQAVEQLHDTLVDLCGTEKRKRA